MAVVAVVGAGFSGLSAAAYAAQAGHEVHVFEKNTSAGGRARQFRSEEGYVFDMGPSWYWMPDIIEAFFNDFGDTVSDHYMLKKLDPAFDMVFPDKRMLSVPGDYTALEEMFDRIEKGSSRQLAKFMKGAEYKYETGMKKLAYAPSLSLAEFMKADLLKGLSKLDVFSSFRKHVGKYFNHSDIRSLMEFPVLFLGAMPKDIPALYSLMNYAGLKLGTWYPDGGFVKLVDAMVSVASRNGANIHLHAPVQEISIRDEKVSSLLVNGQSYPVDAVIASADYQHVETSLLAKQYRNYDEPYWNSRVLAPSCLIVFLGLRKDIGSLNHHTLFFDEDMDTHAEEIYSSPRWPSKPLFYVCNPSRSDKSLAPEGHSSLFLLMPLSPGLHDSPYMREKYFRIMLARLEKQCGEDISSFIAYKRDYCVNDFVQDYNAYKGNAYGLANTLSQTAILKPRVQNRRVKNLFYAGQLTVPGPGCPPAIVSGKIAAQQTIQYLIKNQ